MSTRYSGNENYYLKEKFIYIVFSFSSWMGNIYIRYLKNTSIFNTFNYLDWKIGKKQIDLINYISYISSIITYLILTSLYFHQVNLKTKNYLHNMYIFFFLKIFAITCNNTTVNFYIPVQSITAIIQLVQSFKEV